MITIHSIYNHLLTPELLPVEVALSLQIPTIHIVGLADTEIQESKERIQSAFRSAEIPFPSKKIVINLPPSDIKKSGSGHDLPMALAIAAQAQDETPQNLKILAWGELGLDGVIRGNQPLFRILYAALKQEIDIVCIKPVDPKRAQEALTLLQQELNTKHEPRFIFCRSLKEAWSRIISRDFDKFESKHFDSTSDAKNPGPLLELPQGIQRAVEIAAIGSHHVLLIGTKGSGKSYALQWIEALHDKSNAKSKVYSSLLQELTGQSRNSVEYVGPQVKPPYLLGTVKGGALTPGALALAHGGLLIADEFSEWSRDSREALRIPLEDGEYQLQRGHQTIRLPSLLQFAGTSNPCPCAELHCRCSQKEKKMYRNRLSGPILDRIDVVAYTFPDHNQASQSVPIVAPEEVDRRRGRAQMLRRKLIERWGNVPGRLSAETTEAIIESSTLLKHELMKMRIQSLRERHKIIRIALSIAATEHCELPKISHFREAKHLRAWAAT